jgi:putative transposase
LRKEVLNAEWFHTTKQAQVAINAWLRQYSQIRPHHALGMRPPVPETLLEKTKLVVLRNGARQSDNRNKLGMLRSD